MHELMAEKPTTPMARVTAGAWQRWLSVRAYGLVTSALFGAHTPPERLRARFTRFAHVSRGAVQRKYPGVVFDDHSVDHLHIEALRSRPNPRCAIIHLHGGAFVFGSAGSYRNRSLRLSHRCHAEVFVPDYRLAPEHPFPAALYDALVTYQYVRALRPNLPVFLSGDSAGGGLVLSALVHLRESDGQLPEGALLLSPWTDLSVSGKSVTTNARRDRWLSPGHLRSWARYYAGRHDLRTPSLSPLFAGLHGLPPMLLIVGEHETLLDDSVRVALKARAAGTDARLLVGAGMQHDYPLTLPWLGESKHAWAELTAFIAERCGAFQT